MTPPPDPRHWVLAADAPFKGERPRVVCVGGDGVGPEVVDAAAECLEAMQLPIDVRRPRAAEEELAARRGLPDALKAEIDAADGVLFGAADTSRGHAVPVLRYLRFGLDTYANLRPAVSLPGVPARTGGGGTNMVVVRELTEGMYPGREGPLEELHRRYPELRDRTGRPVPDPPGVFAVRVITERASRRVARYAARLAAHRRAIGVGPGRVTIVDKSNVLVESDGLFQRVCTEEIAAAGVARDQVYVDEAARRMVASPERFDVVVTTNLFGDILSDVSSEVLGGMPMAPSGSIGHGTAYFEPCHGSAPDLAGTGKANPAGTLLSAAMMLTYLHLPAEGARLAGAVTDAIAAGCRTADLGGSASGRELLSEVCRRVRAG